MADEPAATTDGETLPSAPDPGRATLWTLLASATLTVMAGAILGPIVPAIQSNLGVTESLAGLIITTHGALIVAFSPVAGWVIDRVGPRRPFIAGLLLYGAGGGAGLVVDSFGPLLASRAVLGVGVAFVYVGVTVLIYLAANGAAGGTSAALYDRLVARTTRHALVGAAVALWVIAFAFAAVADSALTAVPAVVAFGLGQGLVFPASFAWVEALAPAARRGQYSSYLASAGYTGQFVSPVLFGPLVPAFGVRGVFVAAGALSAVGGAALLVALTRR